MAGHQMAVSGSPVSMEGRLPHARSLQDRDQAACVNQTNAPKTTPHMVL